MEENSNKYETALCWHRGRLWLNLLCLCWILLYAYVLLFKVTLPAFIIMLALGGPDFQLISFPAGYLLAANLLFAMAQWVSDKWFSAMPVMAVKRLIIGLIAFCFLVPGVCLLVLWLRAHAAG